MYANCSCYGDVKTALRHLRLAHLQSGEEDTRRWWLCQVTIFAVDIVSSFPAKMPIVAAWKLKRSQPINRSLDIGLYKLEKI